MESLLTGLPNLKIRQQVRDDDPVDQLHHFVTVCLLAFAGFLIGLKEFYGQPLDCWVNLSNWQHFQTHVNSYCWSHKMYKFPNQSNLAENPYPLKEGNPGPPNPDTEGLTDINFYRWITIIFFVQAFLFKLPSLLWSECNESSGTQIEKMVSLLSQSTFDVKEKRDVMLATLAEFIETWLKINRKPSWFMKSKMGLQAKKILRHCMLCVGGNTGNFLSSMYLVVKFIFLANVFLQFIILTAFLDFNYWHYGPYAVERETSSTDNRNVYFPRIGLCHFQLRGEGHWVQCILSINMLLEKIFLIEWFWMLGLLIITAISFINWIFRTLQTNLSVRFIRKYMSVLNSDGSVPPERDIQNFVMNYLGNDGVFVLRILALNTNDVSMAELFSCIWQRYLNYENKMQVENGGGSGRDSFANKDGTSLEMDPLEAKAVV